MRKHRIVKYVNVVACLLLAGLFGCSAGMVHLTQRGAKVSVRKADPPRECEEVGPIQGIHGSGCGGFGARGSYEGAYNALRNKAATMGANFVRIDSQREPMLMGACFDNEFVIRGVAFLCSD